MEAEKNTSDVGTDNLEFLKPEPFIKIKSSEIFQSGAEYPTDELAGVYHNGIQYIDFKAVLFINNIVVARLIYLVKSLLKQGVKVKLVNVGESIKGKIKSMGLENIFNLW